jgi:hypothetical protein
MTILLYISIGIVGLIALILIAALFSKKEYTTERSITINRSSQDVYDYLRHMKNQEKFSKWVMTDPTMNVKLTGEDGQIGFVYAWDSKNKQAGAGEQELIGLTEPTLIEVEVRFLRPFKGIAKTPLKIDALTATQSRVSWGMSSSMAYPMNAIMFFMNFDKILGNDIEISLKKLKGILEK